MSLGNVLDSQRQTRECPSGMSLTLRDKPESVPVSLECL
nr:MAG TPA: hypothetical protein [Caudoviricetes sp.]